MMNRKKDDWSNFLSSDLCAGLQVAGGLVLTGLAIKSIYDQYHEKENPSLTKKIIAGGCGIAGIALTANGARSLYDNRQVRAIEFIQEASQPRNLCLENVQQTIQLTRNIVPVLQDRIHPDNGGLKSCDDSSKTLSSRAKSNPKAVLHEVMSKVIKIDQDDQQSRVKVIEIFVKKTIIGKMKEVDHLFELLFKEVYHTGSFYDGLRCERADEFDLNLVLDIKVKEEYLKFDCSGVEPGFLKVGFEADKLDLPEPDRKRFLDTLTEEDSQSGIRHLVPAKLRAWFQSILAKVNVTSLADSLMIKSVDPPRASGPAWTLQISTWYHQTPIDVDLVPTFRFKCKHLRGYNEIYYFLERHDWVDQSFFIIPKQSQKDSKQVGRFWRLDFHDIEREVIDKEGYAKNIIRLLKVFRNSHQVLNNLSSYSLKTLVMLMIRDKKLDWKPDNLPDLFLEALDFLKERLTKGSIPYYFHHQCDVLWGLSEQVRLQVAVWLIQYIKKLKESMNTPECRRVWAKAFGLET